MRYDIGAVAVLLVLSLAGCSGGGTQTPADSTPPGLPGEAATLERVELHAETFEIGRLDRSVRATVRPGTTRTTVRYAADGNVTTRTARLPANWSERIVANLDRVSSTTPSISTNPVTNGREHRLTATLHYAGGTVVVVSANPRYGRASVTVDDTRSYYTDDSELVTVLRRLTNRLTRAA